MSAQTQVAEGGLDRGGPAWRVLADGRRTRDLTAPPSLRRTLVAVACASTLALLALLAVVAYVGQRAAQAEAMRDVRVSTELLATAVLEPVLDDAAVRGDPQALRRLDAVVRERVLVEPLVRIKIWTAQGRVLYSDEPDVVGLTYRLSGPELEALGSGVTTSGMADLGKSEHRLDGLEGRLLEVYTPLMSSGGQPLLVETYSRYSLVTARQSEIYRTFLPLVVAALVVLQLCQLPLAWSMVRRLRAGQQQRERLLHRTIQAGEDERRRIAGDLHDTVVQGLVGTSYVVEAAAESLDHDGRPDLAQDLRSASAGVRDSVRGLRTMLLEIYPPHVARAGLSAALQDLVAPLRPQGITTRTELEPVVRLRRDHEALVFRTAQEALRNVARHSAARHAALRLETAGGHVVLTVEDDGKGFDVDTALAQPDGHVGLRVLQGVIVEAGCRLLVRSAPGWGTCVRLEVPS